MTKRNNLNFFDMLFAGGLSVIVGLSLIYFVPKSADIVMLATLMYGLSFICNGPHFLVSYLLLYRDRSSEIFKKPHVFWAAVLVPIILLGLSIWSLFLPHDLILSLLVQVMFVTVGWHYVKQVFGVVVVSSVREGFFMTPWQRKALLFNLYSLWSLSFLTANRAIGASTQADFYGVIYELVQVPDELLRVAFLLTGISLLVVAALFFAHWAKVKRIPSATGLVAFGALYLWFLPLARHPHFLLVIPFFHSLQYLLFVFSLKNFQAGETKRQSLFGVPTGRALLYFAMATLLAAAFLSWIPEFLDRKIAFQNPQYFLALFIVFINVHHYFIDNVLWTRDNPQIQSWLRPHGQV